MPSYNNYGYGFPYYNAPYYQQAAQPTYQQPQVQQPIMFPLILLSNIEEVQRYVVGLNQVVYLKASNLPDIIFEKKTDNTGKTSLIPLKTSKIEMSDIGKPQETINQATPNLNINELASKNDLKALQDYFNQSMINLSNDLKTFVKTQNNGQISQIKNNQQAKGKNVNE